MKKKARDRLPNREAGSFPSFLYKSLDELEGALGETNARTELVERVIALHSKPLLLLSDEELRLALSQQIGFPWLATLVILRLRQDPLRSGLMYEGDILRSALRLPSSAFGSSADELQSIADAVIPTLIGDADYELLVESYLEFKKR